MLDWWSRRGWSRHKGQIFGVYVVPSWRGTGYGANRRIAGVAFSPRRLAAALMQGLIKQARSSGLVLLTLTVTVGNVAASVCI